MDEKLVRIEAALEARREEYAKSARDARASGSFEAAEQSSMYASCMAEALTIVRNAVRD